MEHSDWRSETDRWIGAAIGVNAAFLNIITEWLSDVKLGYCKTAFYLNESFCCWGEDNGTDESQNLHAISDGLQDAMIGTVGALYPPSTTSCTLFLLYVGFLLLPLSANFTRQYLP
jgi:hypothetical protein